jgi:hypothetical protein
MAIDGPAAALPFLQGQDQPAGDPAGKLAAELAVASRLFASIPFEAEPAAYDAIAARTEAA